MKKPRVVIVNRARSEPQQQAQAHYAKVHSAKLIASFRKPKPPSESWWAMNMPREAFYERAHVHEIIPRSLGGNPFEPSGCQLLCQKCHIGGGVHRVEGRRRRR